MSEMKIIFNGEEFNFSGNEKMMYDVLCKYVQLPESFIVTHLNELGFENISQYQNVSEEFIREYQEDIYWSFIPCCAEHKLSEEFFEEFSSKINWNRLSYITNTLSEKFIKKFQNRLNWYYISGEHVLSEEFIREFKDKVDWVEISRSQTLSEEFIREFKDKVDWEFIFNHQLLSEDFVDEFRLYSIGKRYRM